MKVKKAKEELPMPTEDDAFEQEVMEGENATIETPKVEAKPQDVVIKIIRKRGRPRKIQVEATSTTTFANQSRETAEIILQEFQNKKKVLKEQYESELKRITDKYLGKIHKLMGI